MADNLSDEALIRGFLDGDKDCFEYIFERHKERVFKTAMCIVRNEADAEDLVQDIFVQIFLKLNSFKFECQFSTWLYRVTTNFCLMRIRSIKRRPQTHLEDLEPGKTQNLVEDKSETQDIDYMTCAHEIRAKLTAALHKIPTRSRMVYVLRDVDGLSLKEISSRLSIPESNVKNCLHYARCIMREAARKYMETVEAEAA